MALGAMVSNNAAAAQGPIFFDTVTLVGDGAYPTGGSLGLQAKLQTLRGDGRVIVEVSVADGGGYNVQYDALTDRLKFYEQDAGGAMGEVVDATDLSGVTMKLVIKSK
jgi:hypothetical protein